MLLTITLLPMINKESQLYLHFFKTNFPLLLLPALLCGAFAGYYQLQRPAVEHLNVLLEMSYDQNNVQTQIQLTDQAVSLLREINIQKQLKTEETSIQVYKPGPLLLTIDVSAAEPSKLKESLNDMQSFAQSNFPLHQQGEVVHSFQKKAVWIWIAGGLGFGLILGLVFSLTRTYLLSY